MANYHEFSPYRLPSGSQAPPREATPLSPSVPSARPPPAGRPRATSRSPDPRWLPRRARTHQAPRRPALRARRSARRVPPGRRGNIAQVVLCFSELHAIVVPSLPITPHTYPPPLQVLVGASAQDIVKGRISTPEDASTHPLALRTSENPCLFLRPS